MSWYGAVIRGCFIMGIQPLKTGYHPLTGDCRYNLTFRLAVKRIKIRIIIAVDEEMFKLAVITCPGCLHGTFTLSGGSIAGHLSA